MNATDAQNELIKYNPAHAYFISTELRYSPSSAPKGETEYRITVFVNDKTEDLHQVNGPDLPSLISQIKSLCPNEPR